MKKIFFKSMLLLCALIVGSSNVWADVTIYTFTSKSWEATINSIASNWTSGKDGSAFNNNGIQVTTTTTGANGTSPISFSNISEIVLTYNTNASRGAGTAEVKIGSNSETTKDWAYSTGTGTSANYTLTYSYATPQSGNVKITLNTTTNSIYLVSCKITYGAAQSGSETTTTIDASGITTTNKFISTSAGSLSASVTYGTPAATIPDASVTWSGNDDDVATINSTTGEVTLVGAGTVTFTASYEGEAGVYKSSFDTYEMTVTNEDPDLVTIWSEDFSSFSADDVPSDGTYNYACTDGGGTTKIYNYNNAGGTSPELLVAKTNGTFTATIPLLMPSYGYSGDLTLKYKTNANSLNINTTTDGVTVDGEETPGAGLTYSTAGEHTITFKGVTTSTENITIVFTATSGSNVRLDDIILRGKQAELTFVATPTILPASGAVASGTEVTMTCATDGATIYYTTDNTTPTSSSTAYNPSSKPTITAALTIKAIAIKAGLTDSEVASATYTIAEPCATPTFSVAAGEVTKGTTVTISSETDDATIYYTTNGTTPTTSSSVYSSAITINAAMTIKAIAVKDGYANSEVASVLYTIKDYVELPFIWNGGTTTALTNMTGVSASGLGSDYAAGNAPYRQKFDGVGDYIQIKTNTQPGKVYFDVKMLGGATTSKFKVQESADGETFTDVEEFEVSGAQNLVLYFNTSTLFDASSRYIRIIKSVHGSNVGMGPIRITSVVKGFISNAGWSSFASSSVLDLDMIDGGTAYYASKASGSIVTLSPTTATIPAGEGLMIKGTAGEEFTISVAESGTAISGNLLKGQTTTGNVAASTAGTYHYIFGYQTSDPSVCGFYNLAADTEIAAGKAYLETGEPLTLINPNAPAIIRILDEENNATSFERIDDKNDAIKFFENGQIYILREGVVYDALGRKVR